MVWTDYVHRPGREDWGRAGAGRVGEWALDAGRSDCRQAAAQTTRRLRSRPALLSLARNAVAPGRLQVGGRLQPLFTPWSPTIHPMRARAPALYIPRATLQSQQKVKYVSTAPLYALTIAQGFIRICMRDDYYKLIIITEKKKP